MGLFRGAAYGIIPPTLQTEGSLCMTRKHLGALLRLIPVVLLLAWASSPVAGQYGTKNGEWRAYAGEPGNTKYSPLDQINKDNAKNLRIAWRFKTDNSGPRPDFNMQAVPVVVNG